MGEKKDLPLRPRAEYLCIVAFLFIHLIAQLYLAWEDSETIDEPAHLAAALSYTRNWTFRFYNVNPPLSRLIQGAFLIGIPLDTSMIVEPSRDGPRRDADIGDMFLETHQGIFRRLLFLARLGTIVFTLASGLLVWVWGDLAFGKPCGLLALIAWCLNPSVLAHGHLATPDVPATTLAFAAALAFRCYLVAPSWFRALVAGLSLGLAQLAKFTLILFYPIWLLFWLYAISRNREDPRLLVKHGFFALMISLLTLNAGYLFQDTCRRLETYRFLSSKLSRITPITVDNIHEPNNSFAGTWLGSLPVPVPAPYLEGIDLQSRSFDDYAARKASFFLAGQWHEGGSYFYYLYGMLVKTPLALFGLLAIASFILLRRTGHSIDLALLVIIPLVVLAVVSSQKSMNKHVRYVLPMLPFLVVLASAAGQYWQRERGWKRGLVVLLFVWLAIAAGRSLRDPLAYFNEAAGGPRGGARLLAGSNLDWGQGRYRLRDWLEAHPEFRPVSIVCYSTSRHVFADLPGPLPPLGPGRGPIPDDPNEQRKMGPYPGRFAISVRFLQGDVKAVRDFTSTRQHSQDRSYTYFQNFEPLATAGDSVWIYDISLEEANRVRAELGLAALDEP